MKLTCCLPLLPLTLALCGVDRLSVAAPLPAAASVQKLFRAPPREFSTGPLWVWNDLITETQIRGTLRDLAAQGIKQVFVHPRPGLMTPYLSPEWFRLWNLALADAQHLDMNIWIYDENSYPSGFAGGFVPEAMPASRGQGLRLSETKSPPKWDTNFVGVFRLPGGAPENVTGQLQAGAALPEGQPYLVAQVVRSANSPWHANRSYVNLLTPGVTEKFLDVTLEPYRRAMGDQFGQRVPGVFTDEPEIRPAGGLPWCEDLPAQFQQRWGYSLLESLPSLTRPVGDWPRVRHNYFATLNALFIERWAKPYYDYCARHNLELTGHYWDHNWPNCDGVPDNMAMAAWQQRPGIDCLMNQYAENTHAQFGNVRFCREISSLANQLGRARTLVELYGAGGWDLRFEDMKRIGDWLEVLGINTLNQHLSYLTIRGARKRDHPPSFSYHEPWWDAYGVSANYFARLSAALSQGQQVNAVLVLEPTTTAWMYQGDGAKLGPLGDDFFKLLMSLETAQVEYDLGSEEVIAGHGSATNRQFIVGQRAYDVVVLPPRLENLNQRTWQLLQEFIVAGGTVLHADPMGACRKDGQPQVNADAWAGSNERWQHVPAAALAETLRQRFPAAGVTIERAFGDKGILFHHRRKLADGELLFLVNTSRDAVSAGSLAATFAAVEEWNLTTGENQSYPARATARGVSADFRLPPCGSLLLFLSDRPLPAPKAVVTAQRPAHGARGGSLLLAPRPETAAPAEMTAHERPVPPVGEMEIRRVEPNVLTLDYVEISTRGVTRSNEYFYRANQFAWQQNGWERNPWDSAVQFKDELLTRPFRPGSGFTASYRFRLEGKVPANLTLVVERPDLYAITCNGRAVTATLGAWWLDKAFGRIPIAKVARAGENVVTLRAAPMTVFHELEPAYVLGDFALRPAERGFVITPDQPLRLDLQAPVLSHTINPDGTMWLSRGIGFELDARGQPFADRQPEVELDLGRPTSLGVLQVWNYGENQVRNLATRGVDELRVAGSLTGEPGSFTNELGRFRLAVATPGAPAQELLLPRRTLRYILLQPLSNHRGTAFPAVGQPEDNGFVGLAEVRFLDARGARLANVRVHRASSELASHQRTAAHLADGSGLAAPRAGWNQQGHPFYAAGVAYRQQFQVREPAGRAVVRLHEWCGSVAKVVVNGKLAGHIYAPPYECDITPQLRAGLNTVTVTVIGTLKNTLGPHHGNPPAGSAWPSQFQQGPADGPPPGVAYDTISYGLFAPFEVRQVTTRSLAAGR